MSVSHLILNNLSCVYVIGNFPLFNLKFIYEDGWFSVIIFILVHPVLTLLYKCFIYTVSLI